MPREHAEQAIEQSRPDRKPCRLEMEIAAPAVLIGEHVAVAGGDCPAGGWHVKIEPGMHVYIAGFAPVQARMRKQDLSSATEQSEKGKRRKPMGHAHQRGVALGAGHNRNRVGRRRELMGSTISDRQSCIHRSPIPRWAGFYS